MPRPRSLSPDAIAEAALAVIDRDGVVSLSMRTVATELGVGTMSLYRYVTGREQLEGLVVDAVLAGIDLAVPSRASWSARVTLLVERVRDVIGSHPQVAPLLLARRHLAAPSLDWAEALLAALGEGGLSGRDRAIAFRAVLAYLFGAIQIEHLGSLSGAGTAALAGLPRRRYPHLAETAGHARKITPDDEFRRGLKIVLRGLGAER
jgi:AcrR family transcriptional regulator